MGQGYPKLVVTQDWGLTQKRFHYGGKVGRSIWLDKTTREDRFYSLASLTQGLHIESSSMRHLRLPILIENRPL
jgi:hypothetical protein